MAMTTPDELNLTLYRIVTGDTREFITKFTNTQTALETFSAQLNPMVASIAQALADALEEAESTRQQAITDTNAIKNTAVEAAGTATTKAGEAADSAQAALDYRNQTQAIAAGDVDITDLQPGTLVAPKDYASVNEEGALVKRNLSDDVSEQLQSGDESFKAGRIDYASVATTAVLDLAVGQAFRVDASSPVTLTFDNQVALGREAVIPILITGNSAVTWMPELSDPSAWDEGELPTLGDNKTKVIAEWDGIEWSAFVRVAK